MYFIQQYHFKCYLISLYDVKSSSFQDFTFIVAAILDFSAAILKIDQFWLANEKNFQQLMPINISTKFHACIRMCMIIVISLSTNNFVHDLAVVCYMLFCNTFWNNVILYFILIFLFHFASPTSTQNEVKMQ